MPRCVRNYWIELDVDGKKEKVATGPKSLSGGMNITLYLRTEGGSISEKKLEVNCHPDGDVEVEFDGHVIADLIRGVDY